MRVCSEITVCTWRSCSTHADLETPARAETVRNTLVRLLEHEGVVPIINENDSVATEELRLGDNDQLSSRVAVLWGADVLLLLTSVPGLMRDMKRPEDGPIPVVEDVAQVLHHAEEEKSKLGTGGMVSKLSAVQAAVNHGVQCIIASGRQAEQIPAVIEGQGVCTRFPAKASG
jgi:glutamate 5-kinase